MDSYRLDQLKYPAKDYVYTYIIINMEVVLCVLIKICYFR